MTKNRWVLFLALLLVQVSVPLFMILQREQVLQQGQVYRFKTAPVDPYDVFRGRYVALDVEENTVKTDLKLKKKQWVYVGLGQDEQGFAHLKTLSLEPPSQGDYLKARVRHAHQDSASLTLPFDRYYMEEKSARAAELAYNRLNRANRDDDENNSETPAYILVRVLKGRSVLQELYLDGQPVYSYLQAQANSD